MNVKLRTFLTKYGFCSLDELVKTYIKESSGNRKLAAELSTMMSLLKEAFEEELRGMKTYCVYAKDGALLGDILAENLEAANAQARAAFGEPAWVRPKIDAQPFSQTEINMLQLYRKTLEKIHNEYPNASKEYKISSFVCGATDMVMTWAEDNLPEFNQRQQFAREVDRLRHAIFSE